MRRHPERGESAPGRLTALGHVSTAGQPTRVWLKPPPPVEEATLGAGVEQHVQRILVQGFSAPSQPLPGCLSSREETAFPELGLARAARSQDRTNSHHSPGTLPQAQPCLSACTHSFSTLGQAGGSGPGLQPARDHPAVLRRSQHFKRGPLTPKFFTPTGSLSW